MINIITKYALYIVCGAFFFTAGAYMQTWLHTCKVTKIVPCPPQTLITYQIHNDKVKATGNAKIGLDQMIKDIDTKVDNFKKDTLPKPKRKKRFWDFLRRKPQQENGD